MMNRQELARNTLSRTGIRLVVVFCVALRAAETEAAPAHSESEAISYLSQNGYWPSDNSAKERIISEGTISNAIAELQSSSIDIIRNIGAETADLLSSPRCGVKDEIEAGTNGRSKRYAFMGPKWWSKRLTYKISKYTKALNKRVVDREIARAFAEWSKYTDLSFSPSSGRVNIEIRFEHGFHGDEDRFDGPYGVLAHAYPPNNEAETHVHFDDDEHWTVGNAEGINLFQIAVHEFGHALGLNHNHIPSTVMYENFVYQPNFNLANDDIQGIQALYGRKTYTNHHNPVAQPKSEDPQCLAFGIDFPLNWAEGATALVTEWPYDYTLYWKTTPNGMAPGYPQLQTTDDPDNISSDFQWNNGNAILKMCRETLRSPFNWINELLNT